MLASTLALDIRDMSQVHHFSFEPGTTLWLNPNSDEGARETHGASFQSSLKLAQRATMVS